MAVRSITLRFEVDKLAEVVTTSHVSVDQAGALAEVLKTYRLVELIEDGGESAPEPDDEGAELDSIESLIVACPDRLDRLVAAIAERGWRLAELVIRYVAKAWPSRWK